MIRVYYTQAAIEKVSPAMLETWIKACAEQLPAAKREQIMRLRPPLSRFNSAFGWLLVKFGFRHSGRTDFELSRIEFDERKKPRWPGEPYDFNLSHSGSLLACALTDDGMVGIDVEQVRPLQDHERMLEQILSPHETLSSACHDLFFHYWTCKEAVIKAEGSGGVWDMPQVRLQETKAFYKDRNWQLYPLKLAHSYEACVASDRGDQNIHIEAVTCEQLIELLELH